MEDIRRLLPQREIQLQVHGCVGEVFTSLEMLWQNLHYPTASIGICVCL